MPQPAKPSAPAAGAPASQRGNQAPITSGEPIERDESLTDLLRAELDHDGDAPARQPQKPAKKPKPATEEGDDPEGDEPEGDEPEGDEPEGDEPEGDEPEGDEPEGDEPEGEETPEERLERLQQGADESDEDYAARLEEEGVDPADLEAPAVPKVPKNLQKRFGELTGEIKDLKGKLAAAEAKANATPARVASSIEEEVQLATTPEALEALRARFEQWEEIALTNPDGFEQPVKGGEPITYTREQMLAILVSTRKGLRALPAQERFLDTVKANDAAALKAFPAYANPDSPESKAYADIVRRSPQLARTIPDLKLFVADALRGRALRTKAGGQPQLPGRPVVRTQLPPPGGRGAPVRGKPQGVDRVKRASDAKQKVEETGSFDDLTSALEARMG